MGRPPRFTEEFRREAVRLVETGKPLKQIAHELDPERGAAHRLDP